MNAEKPTPKAPNAEIEAEKKAKDEKTAKEIGGFKDQGLLEPTRYGDWDVKGRCSDF